MTRLENILSSLIKARRLSYKHPDPSKGEEVDVAKEYHRGFTEGLEYAMSLIKVAKEDKS